MQALAEFAPLVAFFVTYSLRGLYAATAALMIAMLALLAFDWLRQRRIPTLHAVSAALVLVLGGATLLLHNRLFIQWKPTVLFWLVSAAFVASFWIGERTLTQRFLEPALAGRVPVSPQQWRRVNGASAAFYALLGALNLAVAYGASERTWVYFKLFGLALLTFGFVALQVLWLSRAAAALGRAPRLRCLAMSAQVVARLRSALEQAFAPTTLEILDDSAAHAGHPGASAGGHYRVILVAEAFRGRSRLERHRLVYAAVAPLFHGAVHALNIVARTPEEAP